VLNPAVEREPVLERHPQRLLAWLVFVVVLALINLAGRLTGGETPDDLAYRWVSSIAALIQFSIMLGILLLIARGLNPREVFALRRPRSWARSLGLVAIVLLVTMLAEVVYGVALSRIGDFDPSKEQGLLPEGWDSSRVPPFVAFFLAVTILAPVVEELTFRGLGISLLVPYGAVLAVIVTGALFGAVHGLLICLPVLVFFGLALGWMRGHSDSVYVPMLTHAVFNGGTLIAAVVM